MPTAAKPVMMPPAPPLMAAATRPFSHNSIRVMFMVLVAQPLMTVRRSVLANGASRSHRGVSSAAQAGVPVLRDRDEWLAVQRGCCVVEGVVSPSVVAALAAGFPFIELLARWRA